jgi:hypothetical protein
MVGCGHLEASAGAVDDEGEAGTAGGPAAVVPGEHGAAGEGARDGDLILGGHGNGPLVSQQTDARTPGRRGGGHLLELSHHERHGIDGVAERDGEHRGPVRLVQQVSGALARRGAPAGGGGHHGGREDLADEAVADQRGDVLELREGATLQPDEGPRPSGRIQQGLGLGEVHGQGPLAQDRHAGAQRGQDELAVPRHLDRHDHQVDGLVAGELLDAGVRPDPEGPGGGAGRLRRAGDQPAQLHAVDRGQRGDVRTRRPAAGRAEADDADAEDLCGHVRASSAATAGPCRRRRTAPSRS